MSSIADGGAESAGPLDGVRVIEVGSFIAGPFAGQLLGDLGAEVIKVESPIDGDPMRRWGVCADGRSLWWPTIARNKRSLALDLRQRAGRDVLRDLVGHADVLIENFRPDRLAEWDLGYHDLAEVNPGIVLVHVSGFGQTGPHASKAGFGSIGEAVGGIRHTTGEPDRPSTRTGISLGDSLAALFAVIGCLSALRERDRSGEGQEVDVAIYEAVFALMESTVADYELAGVERSRSGPVLPGVAPSNAYPTRDGARVLIAGNADGVFRRLCQVIGQPHLARDERFATHQARGANMDVLDEIVADWTRQRDAADVLSTMDAAHVPAGPINTASMMLQDPHFAARDMVLRMAAGFDRSVPMAGVVPKLSRTPGGVRHVGPELGEHTVEVLDTLLGHSTHEIEDLLSRRIVSAQGEHPPG